MIDMEQLTTRVVTGMRDYLAPLGVSRVVEMDQQAPKPKYPFLGFKWTTIVPEPGWDRRTVRTVPSPDPRWEKDVEYRYVRNPVMTLSVTAFDDGGPAAPPDRIHQLAQAAHTWFSIPELGGDWLEPTGAVIIEATAITDRDTVLDREIERRQGFDVRLRVVDVVVVTVPTIETVEISGMGGEIAQVIHL